MLRPWVMAGALSACLAAGQPTFDVAAIHKSSPDAKWAYRLGPGGGAVLTGFRVRDLILLAWRTQDFRLLGEPGWAGADRFDIEARAEGSPGEDEFRLMLRSLLEDRFQLILRSESRSMPVFNLLADRERGGLAQAKPGGCTPADNSLGSNEPPNPNAAPSCGFSAHMVRNGAGPVIQLRARAVTLVQIARVLGTTLGRQVNDQTQLKGTFDFVLEYAPEPKSATDVTPGAAPSLPTALREQLGLKLESAKGPVDVLVVDRVTKPSEN